MADTEVKTVPAPADEFCSPDAVKQELDIGPTELRRTDLCCVLPIKTECDERAPAEKGYSNDQLPTHPSFNLVANSEQVLSSVTSRRLLTFEKTCDLPRDHYIEVDHQAPSFRENYFASFDDESRKERREKKMGKYYHERRGIKSPK